MGVGTGIHRSYKKCQSEKRWTTSGFHEKALNKLFFTELFELNAIGVQEIIFFRFLRENRLYNPPFEVNRTMLYVGSKIFQEQITGESSVALLQDNRLTIGGYQII